MKEKQLVLKKEYLRHLKAIITSLLIITWVCYTRIYADFLFTEVVSASFVIATLFALTDWEK